MIGGRKPCESAWKQSIITFPQVIGTYAAPSRGLHQLGSSFLPAFFPVPTKDLLFAVAGFGCSTPSSHSHPRPIQHPKGSVILGSGGLVGILIVWLSHRRSNGRFYSCTRNVEVLLYFMHVQITLAYAGRVIRQANY